MENAKKFLEEASFHSKELGVEVVTLSNAIAALSLISEEDVKGTDPTLMGELGKLKSAIGAVNEAFKNINKK